MNIRYESELYHHGIKGMRWGVRRFRDKNGRLTSAGRKRYLAGGNLRKSLSEISDFKRDRATFENQVWYKHYKDSESEKLYKKAFAIADKWGLDKDDGGGGKPGTPDSARKEYLSLINKAEKEEARFHTSRASNKRAKEVTDKLIAKYGAEKVSILEKREKVRDTIVGATALVTAMATAVVVHEGGKWVLKETGKTLKKGARIISNRIK